MVRKKGETVLDQGPTSLFLFTPSSPLRRLATWICNSKAFETIITCTIILNCVTMMLDEKLGNGDRAILSGQLVSSEFEQAYAELSGPPRHDKSSLSCWFLFLLANPS